MGLIRKWLIRIGFAAGLAGLVLGSISTACAQVMNKRQFNAAANQNVTGTWTFNGPVLPKQGAANPGTCGTGEVFFNTTLVSWRFCSAPNTWVAAGVAASENTTITGDFSFQGGFEIAPGAVTDLDFKTETVDDPGLNHIYDNTMIYGSEAQSSGFNNGWVKFYFRETVDWGVVDAALTTGEALQLFNPTLHVTGTSGVTGFHDAMAINALTQADPQPGETQNILRAASLRAQNIGTGGTINTLEGALINATDGGTAGTVTNMTGLRVGTTTAGNTTIVNDNAILIQGGGTASGPGSVNTGLHIDEITGANLNWGIDSRANFSIFGPNRDEDVRFQINLAAAADEFLWWDESCDCFRMSNDLFLGVENSEVFKLDAAGVEVMTDNTGLIMRTTGAATQTGLFLNDLGHIQTSNIGGSGFAAEYFPNGPAANLTPGSCTLNQMALDTGGATVEWCVCSPVNVWNCVAMTVGGPTD